MPKGRTPQPDATKNCAKCGGEFSRLALKLDWDSWGRRRFCGTDCRRDHDASVGRTSGAYVQELEERRLTKLELECYWTERFTRDEIREMGSALDFLSTEQVAA